MISCMNTHSQAVKYLSSSNFLWVSSSIVWISSAALQIEKTISDKIVAIHITLLHFNRSLFAQANSRKLEKYDQLYECSWHSSENNPVLWFYNSACHLVHDGNSYKCVKYPDSLNAAMQSPSPTNHRYGGIRQGLLLPLLAQSVSESRALLLP
jgi:hypothetical protein